ncbi:MAG: CinA family protein [Gammaproteobacteria bacterium]|nr:CinA family protein [Gammaproteobacteria bacterium]
MENSIDFILQDLAENLIARKWKIVVAESCTGGGIAKAITDLPGSSIWFDRGFVTYSNESKIEMLNVTTQTLNTHGAVSIETATEMVEGALKNSHAQVGLAVTGIAGPDGGTDSKPVGTVCFAWSAINSATLNAISKFEGERNEVREQAVMMAIQGLSELVEKL